MKEYVINYSGQKVEVREKQPLGTLQRMALRISQTLCRHKFRLGDQSETGITESEKPAQFDYFGWKKYYSALSDHPSHTRRIQWPCYKCGKVFYEHCGLDVLSKHGEIL